MQLKSFQEAAVSELMAQTQGLLQLEGGSRKCVLKAPTGAGKTIMLAEWLGRFADQEWTEPYVFMWVSPYGLHHQSRSKLSRHLKNSAYLFCGLEDLKDQPLSSRTILFANWHSLTTQSQENEWTNVFVREREDGRNIGNVLAKTRQQGKELVLIVDESHRNYLTEKSQGFIDVELQPKLIIEVSATPQMRIEPEELIAKKAGFVSVPFEKVVESGLIKRETLINPAVGKYLDTANSANELVVTAAFEHRKTLAAKFQEEGVKLNPLVLIQLPSESVKTSTLDKSVREQVEALLESIGISVANGKLAVWLSEEKSETLTGIEENESEVEALIFKEAIAVGWDCPRAQILVMLREIRSVTFEIQTVGRILRMPHARHYLNNELNQACVFTNLPDLKVSNNADELEFFKTTYSRLRDECKDFNIPSLYLNRRDYGDLTAGFSAILVDKLNERFGIEDTEQASSALNKADRVLELDPKELEVPIISDLIVQNVDELERMSGNSQVSQILVSASQPNVQREFDYLMKAWSLPYAPSRSFTKVKSGLYKWFELLGYSPSDYGLIQRIVACSRANQEVFHDVIIGAQHEFARRSESDGRGRSELSLRSFSPAEALSYGEGYEQVDLQKYGYVPVMLKRNRSEPERKLEQLLDTSDSVAWWIKNGEGQQQFFSITYNFQNLESGEESSANFFPDFIVKFHDGSTGIFETKSGLILSSNLTADKSNALMKYFADNPSSKLWGGIVNLKNDVLRIQTQEKFSLEDSAWRHLDLA